ncbi:Mrp/NBP35 family ATP-binding protein [Acidocella sp.]|uniref:Mrp/NBP35 family ATP-binding protein n=1 Tax=Acidocella sp. TaxID=50710 RepID=UPI002638F6D0|nr:Mrp/NBP35 family ATP-binding protein [Acidocella sp.]
MNENDVRAALAPFGMNGRIDGVFVKDGLVQVSLTATREEAARLEPMRRDMAAALGDMPGVKNATVMFTAAKAPEPEAPPALLKEVAHVVAVASGKGGVGKSTVATNLALALAAGGLRVGLLDADIYGPSLPTMLGSHAKPEVRDGLIEPLERFGVKMMSIGLLVPPEKALVWRGPMVMGALNQMLGQVNWGRLDVLVVDLPPGTGDAQLTLAQKAKPDGAVIVSTPQDVALIDARRGTQMFAQVNVPVLGIVENMSYFCCPNCGHRAEIFGHGGARAEAEKIGVPFLGEIPLELAVRESGDAGRPVILAAPQSAAALAFTALGARVRGALGA